MFRQQLKERQEEQNMKEESLDEVKVMSGESFHRLFVVLDVRFSLVWYLYIHKNSHTNSNQTTC